MSFPLKFDQEKIRLELIPPEFLWATGRGLTYGARKYSPGNWATGEGFEWSRLYGGLLRHLTQWNGGEDIDQESGNHHLDHACCMLAFLVAHVARQKGIDDRQANGVAVKPPQSKILWPDANEPIEIGSDPWKEIFLAHS